MCYTAGVKLNLANVREDGRRFGLVIAAASLLGVLFQGANPWLAVGGVLVGFALVWICNLEE